MKQVVTVKEARKILGEDYELMSDEMIQKLIDDLSSIARYALQDAKEKRTKESQKS